MEWLAMRRQRKANEKDEPYRLVVPKQNANVYQLDTHCKHNLPNGIKTTKYTLWNFLPKNLFEQFYRFANMYFLFIVILNWVPAVNAFGKEIAMFPLLFVLSVTAVKDLFEDRRRYKSDKRINSTLCQVYDSSLGRFVATKWEDVVVGDIVHLDCDEVIPADVLLLNSEDDNGICFIETCNLDGETNLKQREVVRGFLKDGEAFNPQEFKHHIKCEEPNNHIYKFNGFMTKENEENIPVDKHNLLLRGCVVRNTRSVQGIVVYAGHDTKAMLNNSGPRSKHSKLERDINWDVMACVGILLLFCSIGGIGCGLWTERNSYFNKQFVPVNLTESGEPIVRRPLEEGLIRFWTFIIILQVLIPISLYITLEAIKLGQIFFISNSLDLYHEPADQPVICRALNINEDLGQIQYIFSDKTGTLTENKMVFKRCTIAGQDYPHQDKYDDEACKERRPNSFSIHKDLEIAWDSVLAEKVATCCGGFEPESISYLKEFFIVLAICNTVIVSRTNVQKKVNPSSGDRKSVLKNAQFIALPSPSHSCSSPTGSETILVRERKSLSSCERSSVVSSPLDFPDVDIANSDQNFIRQEGLELTYEAESPDEAALVQTARNYGFQLLRRSPESVTVNIPGEGEVTFEILHILGFDSSRKRMSVIVRRPQDGAIVLYCKGADSAILSQLASSTAHADDEEDPDIATLRQRCVSGTENHLNMYAAQGLRTLCMARRVLSEDEYTQWRRCHRQSELALTDRDKLLWESACSLETGLELLGGTGIEDRLQEGVPEAIATLRAAGLKVWVLTGDKQETAVNIAYSCKLLEERSMRIVLNAKTKDECAEMIKSWLSWIQVNVDNPQMSVSLIPETSHLALIIDGHTLAFTLDKPLNEEFLKLAAKCHVVICCRAAPIQKASVVKLVKENLRVMTMAVGDGANDVSMIQMSDVGVGICGQEGMQAVMASDFALAQFRFLVPLLLAHGHWCYYRISKVMVYFFYKNAMFVFFLFWFQIFNGFSGSNAIDDFSLIFFNLIFTSLPPVVMGILDQDISAHELKRKPWLYKQGRESMMYSRKLFWLTIADALYQSLALFFVCYLVYNDTSSGLASTGITMHQTVVVTASLQLAIDTSYWTIFHHAILWLSVLASYIWCLVFSVLDPANRMYYVALETMSTKEFWLISILAPVIALLPKYVIKSLKCSLRPNSVQRARIVSMYEGPVLMSYTRSTSEDN